jgi:hypothetical protein
MPVDRAMNEVEAADRLGLRVATLRAWRHRSKGPRFVRFGRAVRYLPADLDRFIQACGVDTGAVSQPDALPGGQERL